MNKIDYVKSFINKDGLIVTVKIFTSEINSQMFPIVFLDCYVQVAYKEFEIEDLSLNKVRTLNRKIRGEMMLPPNIQNAEKLFKMVYNKCFN